MYIKLGVTLLITCWVNFSQAKELAITFDDSPRHATGYFDGKTRALKLIEQLKQNDVPQVAFFSVSSRLDDKGIDRLNLYANAGHIIANHTHSHPDFNQLTLAEYRENFLKADKALSTFNNYKKWFRFPYLREGNTQQKRDGMRKLLADKGYLNAYITLNNYDWYMENLFQQAIKQGKDVDLERMSRFYVQQLIESIEYYDQLAIKHLGYSPKHVLLLHEMDISALFIGDLVKELREQGWKIISVEDAYTDKIAHYQTENIFKFNPGRVGEIAKDNGQTKMLWHHSLDEKHLKQQFEQQVLNR